MSEQPNNSTTEMSRVPPPQRSRPTEPPALPSDLLRPVTRRGRLVTAPQAGGLDLQTEHGRFELLGPFGIDHPHEGDEVEVVGVPAPFSRSAPALLIRQMRRLD
jgi:hypothetical protein